MQKRNAMIFTPMLPEVRRLIQIARLYVVGEIHFSFVCNAVSALEDALRYVPAEPAIKGMAKEWSFMALRVWPEMVPIQDPISEQEFLKWVQAQLVVFQPLASQDDE